MGKLSSAKLLKLIGQSIEIYALNRGPMNWYSMYGYSSKKSDYSSGKFNLEPQKRAININIENGIIIDLRAERKNPRIRKLAAEIKADPQISVSEETSSGYTVYATEKYRLIEITNQSLYSPRNAKYEKEAARFLDQQIIFTSK